MHNTILYYSIDQAIMQGLTGMDISAMLSFTHHATNLASHNVE